MLLDTILPPSFFIPLCAKAPAVIDETNVYQQANPNGGQPDFSNMGDMGNMGNMGGNAGGNAGENDDGVVDADFTEA